MNVLPSLQTIRREVNYYKSMLEILDFKQEAAQQKKTI